MSFNVFELREIDELLGELDRLLWKMNWGPESNLRLRCHLVQKRIKQLIQDQVPPEIKEAALHA